MQYTKPDPIAPIAQAESMHPIAEAGHTLGKQLIKVVPVGGSQEHVLPGVAAQDDVVQATGEMKTGFASHVTNNITNGEKYAIYQA